MHECGIIMTHDASICGFQEYVSCCRPSGHAGDHVSRNQRGEYFLWSFDEEYCGEDCACMEDGLIECCTWRPMSEDEAQKYIQNKDLTEG